MLNGCHGRPRPVAGKPLQVQDGWHSNGRRRMVTVPFTASVPCQYAKTTPDPRCAGCVHERKEE